MNTATYYAPWDPGWKATLEPRNGLFKVTVLHEDEVLGTVTTGPDWLLPGTVIRQAISYAGIEGAPIIWERWS